MVKSTWVGTEGQLLTRVGEYTKCVDLVRHKM
jgi:hypothetical protein